MLSQGAAEGKDGTEITQEKPLAQAGCPPSAAHISHSTRMFGQVPLESTGTRIHSWQTRGAAGL